MLKLILWNGATTKDAWNEKSPEFVDDFKPEDRVILCTEVQVTYRDHIKVTLPDDGEGDDLLELFWSGDQFIEYDGCFFGDFTVQVEP